MARGPKSCETCRTPLVRSRLSLLEGAADDQLVKMSEFPVLTCPLGHEVRELRGDFHVEWTEDLGYEKKTLWAEKRGLLGRRRGCGNCGQEMDSDVLESATRELTLLEGSEDEFGLEVRGPMLRCANCGTRQIPPQNSTIFDATSDAVERGQVKRY